MPNAPPMRQNIKLILKINLNLIEVFHYDQSIPELNRIRFRGFTYKCILQGSKKSQKKVLTNN